MYRPCMNCGVKMSECDIDCSFKEIMEELKKYRDAEEQKVPCYLPDDCDCKYSTSNGCVNKDVCGYKRKPLTIGDKIRESNESISAFIRGQFGDDRVFHGGNQIDLDDFLNQSYKEDKP